MIRLLFKEEDSYPRSIEYPVQKIEVGGTPRDIFDDFRDSHTVASVG